MTSQTGDSFDSETKATSVEDALRDFDKVTVTDSKENPPLRKDDYAECVVVPLPEVDEKKSSKCSTSGREIDVNVNGYPIRRYPTKPVYLYEVRIWSLAQLLSEMDKANAFDHDSVR